MGALAGILLAALFVAILPILSEQTGSIQEVLPTQYAPAFEMETINTEAPIALADYSGQGVVLNFWASWCHPCREEMPALESAWQKYKDQGIVFIGANSSDSKEEALSFLDEYGITYANGSDLDSKVSQLYQVQGLPTTWFIAGDGSVEKKVYGPLDLAALDAAIALILPEAGG